MAFGVGIVAALLLLHIASGQSQLECPALFGQLGEPWAVPPAFSVFLDPQQLPTLPSRIFFIQDGEVSNTFASLPSEFVLSTVAAILQPANLTSFPVQFTLGASSLPLHFSISVFSLAESVASAACASPHTGSIEPDTVQTVRLTSSCLALGTAIQQVCLTIGDQPFTSLNGTYSTFTFFLPLVCPGGREQCPPSPTLTSLIAEMCISSNMSTALVNFGAGSWALFANVLRLSDASLREGYCVVDDDAIPPGLIDVIKNEKVNILYAIPSAFSSLEVFFVTSKRIDATTPLSYSVTPVSENKTVVEDPVTLNDSPLQGVTYDGRVDFLFDLTCKNRGLTRIFVNFNVSAVVEGVLYSNTYPDLYFYRNCTTDSNDTVLLVTEANRLGVQVGVPLTVVFVLVVGVGVVILLLMLHFTRRYRKKVFHLEQEHQLDLLATSNAYMLSTFENEINVLRESGLEYNYASLEVVGELGEGAFGRVFKATAPGLQQDGAEQQEFVAVKTLKEEADSDALVLFLDEVKTSAQFRHPNVIRLIGICTETSYKCMIFEYMDLGSLNDILRRSDPANPSYSSTDQEVTIAPDQFLSCCVQLAQGLAYLSSLKFVHRDIATRNCLLNSSFTVKIADFGLSREVCARDYYRIGSATACLPVRWMPPEALLYGKFTVKSDVWSYGITMWEVYSYARQPFGGISNYEVIDRVKSLHMLECPDLCPASIFDIIKGCWIKVPQRRPPIASILQRLGHLARSHSMNTLDDYTTMGQGEGYLNLGFNTTVTKEELREMERVAALGVEPPVVGGGGQGGGDGDQTSEGGDPRDQTSEEGDPRDQTSIGGDPRDQTSEGGDPRDQKSEGGDPRDQTSEGGDPRDQMREGGDLRDQTSCGGDEDRELCESGDPNTDEIT